MVTPLVAKFPLKKYAAKVLPIIWMERYFYQMLRWSCSLVIMADQVCKRNWLSSAWLTKNYFHTVVRGHKQDVADERSFVIIVCADVE